MNLTTVFNTFSKMLKKAHTLEILLVTSATPYSLCVCVCVCVCKCKYIQIHTYVYKHVYTFYTHVYMHNDVYNNKKREVLTKKIGKIRSCIRF